MHVPSPPHKGCEQEKTQLPVGMSAGITIHIPRPNRRQVYASWCGLRTAHSLLIMRWKTTHTCGGTWFGVYAGYSVYRSTGRYVWTLRPSTKYTSSIAAVAVYYHCENLCSFYSALLSAQATDHSRPCVGTQIDEHNKVGGRFGDQLAHRIVYVVSWGKGEQKYVSYGFYRIV